MARRVLRRAITFAYMEIVGITHPGIDVALDRSRIAWSGESI